ncbi:pseudouridine synthase [Aridibaculum aurantiacum]|uniref:pseudouridine synthase n=1 Tax=Aridibaculum aurantiacum TaxID=2810307 RepID=UPI001F62287D|nr:pseudouridine synthase [Aridibaculum aurantiacum]
MRKRTDNFDKFVKKPKGSAIKEKIKQEKKKEKKERAAAIEAHYARKREEKLRMRGIDPDTIQPKGKPGKPSTANKYKPAPAGSNSAAPTAKPAFNKATPGDAREGKDFGKEKKLKPKYVPGSKKERTTPIEPRITTTRPDQAPKPQQERKPQAKIAAPKKEERSSSAGERSRPAKPSQPQRPQQERPAPHTAKQATPATDKFSKKETRQPAEQMPLNKYIAHSGVCARRDAAILVKDGKVTVNGEVVTDPGTKVTEYDEVTVSGKKLTISKNFVYILLNKPKDYITTSEDPQGRKTVLDLVRTATSERVYPVGRLDRNTSGVLLLTNDGDLAQKLSHPKHEIKKVYEVRLDRPLTKADMEKIASGITLEDGFIAPDVIAYADSKDKSIIGVEIHSGRNRIVRRIFEHLKYDVKALDRVMFAGLTKKDVLRGNWRFLKEKEVRLLKYMNQSFAKKK